MCGEQDGCIRTYLIALFPQSPLYVKWRQGYLSAFFNYTALLPSILGSSLDVINAIFDFSLVSEITAGDVE